MAPGFCVTSFRMLMRRSELKHFVRVSCGLRLRPAPVAALALNSWDARRRAYCTDKSEKYLPDSDTGQTELAAGVSSHPKKTTAAAKTTKTPTQRGIKPTETPKKTPTTTRGNIVKISGVENAKTTSLRHNFSSSFSSLKENEVHTHTKEVGLSKMKVSQLKDELRKCGLNVVNGTKRELIERLENYLRQKGQPTSNVVEYNENSKTAAAESASFHVIHDGNGNENVKGARNDEVSSPLAVRSLKKSANAKSATGSRIKEDAQDSGITARGSPNEIAFHHPSFSPRMSSEISCSAVQNAANPSDVNHSGMRTKSCNDTSTEHDNVCVEYIQGLPHLTVPLPSRNEKCRFALKPVSHKVGDLIDMLKTEDRGIDRAAVLNESGVRIASTCNIESLMDEPFWLHINDQKYKVIPPQRDRIKIDDLSKLGDVRALVAQLYEALNVGEYHLQKEQEMKTKLEDLKYKIAPLERQKTELSTQAERRTNMMTWVGLGLMSVQFGILARLTWWEYSWDIMEPVTYFVTYGTAMAMYAYFCITKTEYNMPEVKDRHYLLTIHKRAKRINFDVDEYNSLKRQIAEIEYDLRRLHDPLNMQLPPHVDRSQQLTLPHSPTSSPSPPSSSDSSPSALSSLSSLSSSLTSQSSSKPALTTRISNKKSTGFKIPFLEPKE